MHRRFVILAVISITTVMTGCSVTQVTAWFAFYRHQAVSPDQARSIADTVNRNLPAGQCDSNYAGGCVPNNQAVVHCAGLPGDGPAVTGPLQVTGWDHFHLDPDGDKTACPGDPVGSLDSVTQSIGGIAVSGWALDPDSPSPTRIDIYDGGFAASTTANIDRSDLAAAYPGDGTAHGFSTRFDATFGRHNICAFAINVAGGGINTLLGCRVIDVEHVKDFVDQNANTETVALLESAVANPDGSIHLTGFVYDVDTGGLPVGAGVQGFGDVGEANVTVDLNTDNRAVSRPDVVALDPAAPPVSGFDITLPSGPHGPLAFYCIQQNSTSNPGAKIGVSCRFVTPPPDPSGLPIQFN